MDFILNLVAHSVRLVLLSFLHNWPFLLASIVIAALLQLFVDAKKVSAFLGRHRRAGIVVATTAAVTTPLCSCGTTAVVLGMMASTMPWAPIVAFIVASPLSSPEGMIYSAGIFGWPFAAAMFVVSILLGLAGGSLAAIFERRGWLANQSRMTARARNTTSVLVAAPALACGCGQPVPVRAGGASLPRVAAVPLVADCGCAGEYVQPDSMGGAGNCGCDAGRSNVESPARVGSSKKLAHEISRLGKAIYTVGARLLPMFLGFAFIGYLLNGLIPAGWVSALFGGGHAYGVPLAATLGLPLYLNSEASLPMVRALLDSGMSQGAVMAFLIAGSGTSMGAIAGALTIARWRVVALVVGVLWIGAMLAGFGYDALLAMGRF
jgi:uncharacterized membrane protein YraQ (UPF0718 family)